MRAPDAPPQGQFKSAVWMDAAPEMSRRSRVARVWIAIGGFPGTVGWRGRPLVHAFRCTGCEILALQYGTDPTSRT